MSLHRISPAAGWVDASKLPKGPNGRALCRQCSAEVPKGCRTFCSDACVEQWKLKTQPGFMRRRVEQRDEGVCRQCGRDTETLKARCTAWLGPADHGRGPPDSWGFNTILKLTDDYSFDEAWRLTKQQASDLISDLKG